MELCIVIIQVCLLICTCLIVWCEISRVFSDTFKKSILRFTLAVSFLVLGFYAKFLLLAPYLVVFAAFTVCVCFTVLFIKLLIHEHDKRIHILNYRKNIKEEK